MYNKKNLEILIYFLLFISISLIVFILIIKKDKNKKSTLSKLSSTLFKLNLDDKSLVLKSRFNNYLKIQDYNDGIMIKTYDKYNNDLPITFGNTLNINDLLIKGDLTLNNNLNTDKNLSANNISVSNLRLIDNERSIQMGQDGPYITSGRRNDFNESQLSWGTNNKWDQDKCVFFTRNC